jgi:hypothetical protein
MNTSKTVDAAVEVVKAAPAVIVSILSLQDWVYIATLGYLALQAAWLLWKWARAVRSRNWRPEE